MKCLVNWNKRLQAPETLSSSGLSNSSLQQVVLTKICVQFWEDVGRNWEPASNHVDSFILILCIASASSIITTTILNPPEVFLLIAFVIQLALTGVASLVLCAVCWKYFRTQIQVFINRNPIFQKWYSGPKQVVSRQNG